MVTQLPQKTSLGHGKQHMFLGEWREPVPFFRDLHTQENIDKVGWFLSPNSSKFSILQQKFRMEMGTVVAMGVGAEEPWLP